LVIILQRTVSVATICSELGRIGLRKCMRSSLYEQKPIRQNIMENYVHHPGSIDSDRGTSTVC
jgi:hypothetical protein